MVRKFYELHLKYFKKVNRGSILFLFTTIHVASPQRNNLFLYEAPNYGKFSQLYLSVKGRLEAGCPHYVNTNQTKVIATL